MNAIINKLPTFKNAELLATALSHRSSLNERSSGTTSKESNERLEFLGDAVLELAATRFLYTRFPDEPEGQLTSVRSALVKTTTLARVALELGIDHALFMSKGEEATGGRTNESILADATEAVIGALYMDQGFEVVDTFLHEHLFGLLDEIMENKLYKDDKSQLQEIVQSQGLPTPIYHVVGEEGPDHDKQFTVEVLVDNQVKGVGTGKSKQAAQQQAAAKALSVMTS